MFDFWYELPPLLRACFALVLLGIAALIYFLSGGTRFAIGIGAVGAVLLIFSGAGHDNSGYKF